MNVHQNARLTPAGRALLVERIVVQGQTPRQVAAAFGVSVPTVRKWVGRWHVEGLAGLVDRSSRPRRIARRTSWWREQEIARLRRRRWTAPRIARRLGMPLSTVVVVQRRLGMARLGRLEPPALVVRYERRQAGELLHVDVKKLGRIGVVGHRIHGDRRRRTRRLGWEYLHVAIDDATRVAYFEVLPDERGDTCARFLERAADAFLQQGIPRIERVMTDNAKAYGSHEYQRVLARLEARWCPTRPYTPRTNGKAERLIQTALREWAYARPYASSADRLAALPGFARYYNEQRAHAGIGHQPPRQRLAQVGAVRNNHPVNNS